ncbi:AAA domain-containing protein [Mesorhizobium sp. VK25A]|uniref:Phospholipase D n=1 Tax=Mesorhizobium vachelliae TaxID=3072309 RepID=A0ABU5A0A5_9HYPH|nr:MULTISPECIES: AAA domain-containing protein [unclassified Mesorhizobium]MDX8530082.1 AAA domain-containing protein [Mesorhizobium sp. VK25D]MDX8544480.1 AAA domain-containing protein [Mesorhizobium sp. VK25A]
MTKADLAILKYWRSSVADSAIGDACLTSKMLEEFYSLSREEAETGILGRKAVDFLFDKVPPHVRRIAVSYRPFHVRRQSLHTRSRGDGLPLEVTPVVTEAQVTREGRIIPNHSVIARDILDPLARGAFSVGRVADLDSFLTAQPFAAKEEDPDLWQHYQNHWQKMMAEVGGNWPAADPEYQIVGHGVIRPATEAAATVKQILDLSDALIRETPESALLANFARRAFREAEPARQPPFPLAERLGHSSDEFPVADHQREVLAHLAATRDGDILAVNGPPGTGKTTMLLSAIAGAWVSAALAQADPPLIVAASTNNQAVTNIIDAFGKDFARGQGRFAGRWLPDIKSFGLFLAALSREAEASAKYQTELFFQKLETSDYLKRAREAYLEAARNAFPDLTRVDVAAVVAALHRLLREESSVLVRADEAYAKCRAAHHAVQRLLGDEPGSALLRLREAKERCTAEKTAAEGLLHKWEGWLAAEPMLLSLFGFLPPVGKKQVLRARVFLREARAPEEFATVERIDEIEGRLKAYASDTAARTKKAKDACDQAEQAMAEHSLREEAWRTLAASLLPNSQDGADLLAIDRAADRSVRFRLFLLATHYWEGRWLLEMEKALPSLQRVQKTGRGGNDRSLVGPMWSRRMMLTPCAVSTFATLPRKMTCRDNASGSYRTEYLFNHIDLLIVDEAGQVLPEVAGPSFALAKRALVIGDIQQIEPISTLTAAVDTGNLIEAGLLPPDAGQEALQALDKVGLTSRSGSAMRLAQSACRFYAYPELERGLYLFEHRRCFDEIISFCNELCYKGALQPMRGPAKNSTLQPMGYLHIDGMAISSGGSRFNPLEAQTIAAWLAANAEKLKARYGKRLEDIVGIVTPFGRQVREIRRACADRGIDIGRHGMTVGTVHALQGAERDVVIFSPVYSKHADGSFIDLSPSMLNVAASRAKDAFLVFGDMDTLASAPPGSPRSVLANFLSRDKANEMVFDVPSRTDLSKGMPALESLRDAAEHDAFLLKEFANARRRLCVVSPWINIATMKQVGFTEAIIAARARGVEVEIYADPDLTRNRGKSGQDIFASAHEVLTGFGAKLHAVQQLHTKLVWGDDAVLAVGSFNWFSAHRTGEFARHETSIVYRGKHLGPEIQTLEDSLKARTRAL